MSVGIRRSFSVGVVSLCVLVGVLVSWSARALAAGPEAPGPVTVEAVTATSAAFSGELNPGKEGAAGTFELGTYEFLYRKSPTTCEGESRAPESPGIALGGGMEVVAQPVSGLEASTEYTVCLLARNGIKGETTVGPAEQFTTAARPIPVEAPEKAPATGVTATTATLHGVLNPHGKRESEPGAAEFRFRESATECQGENEKTAALEKALEGHEGEAVEANVSGLLPGASYTFCLRAVNGAGEEAVGLPETFTTPAIAPKVESESVSNVAAGSATLEAQVNPEGADTTYHFQYGTSTAYGESIPTPEGDAGPGTSTTGVQAHPQDLKPHTVYHYRVLVTNAVETVTGPDQTFTTQPVGEELTLPDGRQWEMVSPPVKDGADFFFAHRVPQAAENGDAVTYLASAPTEANPPGDPLETQVLSTRGAGGWSSRDISVPQVEPSGVINSRSEYLFFSADLSLGLVEPFAPNVSLLPSEPTVYSTVYIHDNVGGGGYTPVITAADVLPGTEKYGAPVVFQGATPDLSHVVLSSTQPLTSPPPVIPNPGEGALYEWSGGSLQIVSVLPASEGGEPVNGSLISARSFGAPSLSGIPASISNDGSRVVWSGGPEGHLYMRDVAKEETVRLNAVQGGSGTVSGGGRLHFLSESGDGSRVVFGTNQRLTGDSSPEGEDLYECAMIEVAGKLTCKLTDLTVSENAGENANVEALIGASQDGSYIYFVATGVLAHNALGVEPGYHVYVRHNGTTTYIATLSPTEEEWEILAREPELFRGAQVSPNGRYVAFASERSLTGYNDRDASSGEPDKEAYLYDAESNRLVCASCNPTGARPVGAGVVPGVREQHYLSNSGRLFFGSSEALVAQDTNGQPDVYEYEPAGVGGCTASGAMFSEVSGGCVGLISSGSSDQASTFVDASASGDDVFFLTDGRLAPQDLDTSFDVYDAHVCSAAVPCSTSVAMPPVCTTADSCRAAPSLQPAVFGAPASATFSGSGNPTPSVVKPAPPKQTKAKGKPKRRAGKHRRHRKAKRSKAKRSLSARTRRQKGAE